MNTDISVNNIIVPNETASLTSGLTGKDWRGIPNDLDISFILSEDYELSSSARLSKAGNLTFSSIYLQYNVLDHSYRTDLDSFFDYIMWCASTESASFRQMRYSNLSRRLIKFRFLNSVYSFQERLDDFQASFQTKCFVRLVKRLRTLLHPALSFEAPELARDYWTHERCVELGKKFIHIIDEFFEDNYGHEAFTSI